jgi:hypothetical protein
VTELLDRAQQLVAAGPHSAASEIAAVHAALYPDRDAVCQTCRGELGKAYYAIQRWVSQQASSSLFSSTDVKKHTTARFHSDDLIYTPHGLGVAYSNANLTDKAARDILKADPDAAQHFAVLPPEASDEEQAEALTASQQATAKQVEQAQHPVPAPPAGLDYGKLAAAILDEQQRRAAAQPASTEVKTEVLDNNVAVTTGHTDGADDQDDEKPVRLSRMNKEQLVATYRAELNLEPLAELTNDQLRDAIAEKRASLQDPE